MPYVLLDTYVTIKGEEHKPGEVVELGKKSAEALVNEGKARPATPDAETAAAVAAADLPSDAEVAANQEADLALTKKALDDQYKRDELAEAAKAAGVDYAYDAKKAEIIEAVVSQGKAAALLK